jgi:hypothetical protein
VSGELELEVKTADGGEVDCETAAGGWHFPAEGELAVQIAGFADGLVCRVAPGDDRDVVQLGIGAATGRLCNALYSPHRDIALVFRGDEVRIEPPEDDAGPFTIRCQGPLTVTVLDGYMKLHRGLEWFVPLDRARFPRAPAGWCSWYYYYQNIDEREVVRNTDWLAEHLRPFGCEWVQIDDGWQGRGRGHGTNRDWFVTCEKDFPRGMKWCADYIRSKGFRPGIWCIPFTQSDEALFEQRPELFLRRPDGTSVGRRDEPLTYDWMPPADRAYEWAGRYFIDPTSPGAEQYLRRLFEMLCDAWGYEYVKIDGQGLAWRKDTEHRAQRSDASLDGDRAYRKGLAAIRSAVGPDRFVLNCGQAWCACGLCEGIRIGGDVDARKDWEGFQMAVAASLRWLYLNTIAFYTDPDVVCVREEQSFEHARLWATFVGVTGQLLMASDKMDELPEQRVELLRRIFPVADIRPMELYPLEAGDRPAIFDLKVALPRVGRWDVAAVFNWGSDARRFTLSPDRLGLEGRRWLVVDYPAGTLIHSGDGEVCLDVPGRACRVVSYWAQLDRPTFVGTNRHLTQGAVDVESVSWDASSRTLRGVSNVVGGDPYRVRIFVPEGFRPKGNALAEEGGLHVLEVVRPRNARVEWEARFEAVGPGA